jgi:hypothetical protein
MFGLTTIKKYDKLKKMYIELMNAEVRKLESGYLYMVGLPGADAEATRAIAKTFALAMKANKIKRTQVLCIGNEFTMEARAGSPKPSGLPEIPVPKPIRRKKQ